MEPVPETEGMEHFRASPVPSLRLQESSLYEYRNNDRESKRPPTLRRVTDPVPSSPRSPGLSSPLPYRSRNTSPYSRGHLRSKSSTALAPPMSRAQSLPGIHTTGQLMISPQRPSSPLGSPNRVRTPRKPADEVFPGFPARNLRDISETGGAESPDHTPRAIERSVSPILGLPSSASYTRARRPASPLRHLAQQNASAYSTTPTTPSSASSPSYQSAKFNEALLGSTNYGAFYSGSYASSSVPSTPTSIRSRSPSISSLETIPDTPDAEEAAVEAERIAQLKADADAADSREENKDKGMEGSGGRGRTLGAGFGRDKRKRWSVCGAERRGDLNLDTIWEDGA